MKIYVYQLNHAPEELKIGQTSHDDVHIRIRQQVGTANIAYTLLHQCEVVRADGTTFGDRQVHQALERMGVRRVARTNGNRDTELFRTDLATVKTAIASVVTGRQLDAGRHQTFDLRPEQQVAVERTAAYFRANRMATSVPPHFLWNAKMRFGKTFTTYQLAREMGWSRILVLTYKPAVAAAWRDDLLHHVDFADWQFVDKGTPWSSVDETGKIVWFASFQDVMGKTRDQQVKERNEALYLLDWDCIVLDEYHFGAWRDNAKDIYSLAPDDEKSEKATAEQEPDVQEVESLPITAGHYLYLSGTPFKAISEGEFTEDQIFNWTYPDEQAAKANWIGPGRNPYRDLPRMELRTYLIGDTARTEATAGEFNEFSLTDLFRARKVEDAHGDAVYEFMNDKAVVAWLDTIAGRNKRLLKDALRANTLKVAHGTGPQFPYADSTLRDRLRHVVWYLPDVASCRAMSALLAFDPYFGGSADNPKYRVVDLGGNATGTGLKALDPVRRAIDPDDKPTITLTCGKLMTGVTVPEWSGIFMLRGSNSPESYFQSAFRVQSPWTRPDADAPDGKRVLKDVCYVFDFDPQRALRLVGEFATRLSEATRTSAEAKVAEFTTFLPIFCYDDGEMLTVDPTDILAIADAGVSSTMMVRKWRSGALVSLDGAAFESLLADDAMMAAIAGLEQFRKKSVDVKKTTEVVIAAEDALKKAKREKRPPTPEEDAAIKEARDQKKKLRESLVAFLQRIPAFMYITDAREQALADVIRAQDSRRFERATGLSIEMFERMASSGLLNGKKIDAAILAFKRYEDASLEYAGNARERNSGVVGGMFRVYSKEEADRLVHEAHVQDSAPLSNRDNGGISFLASRR